MTRYALYCFDVDDTLVATYQHTIEVLYPGLAERANLPAPTKENVRLYWGRPLIESLAALFPQHSSTEHLAALLCSIHNECPVRAQPQARRILRVLQRHGRRVALFSNGDGEIVRSSLRHALGMSPQDFDALYLLSERGEAKGAAGVLDRIRAEVKMQCGLDIPASDTLVVGDDPRDWRLAAEGGAGFAALTTGVADMDDHLAAGIPQRCIFSSLREALSLPTDHGVVAIIKDERGRFLLAKEGRADNPFYGAWSGPHGRCRAEDILEEETVARETREELGINVRPLRQLLVRPADTKVSTVAFWAAERVDASQRPSIHSDREVSEIGWFSLAEIRRPGFPLYHGTRDFFSRYEELTRTDVA